MKCSVCFDVFIQAERIDPKLFCERPMSSLDRLRGVEVEAASNKAQGTQFFS